MNRTCVTGYTGHTLTELNPDISCGSETLQFQGQGPPCLSISLSWEDLRSSEQFHHSEL